MSGVVPYITVGIRGQVHFVVCDRLTLILDSWGWCHRSWLNAEFCKSHITLLGRQARHKILMPEWGKKCWCSRVAGYFGGSLLWHRRELQNRKETIIHVTTFPADECNITVLQNPRNSRVMENLKEEQMNCVGDGRSAESLGDWRLVGPTQEMFMKFYSLYLWRLVLKLWGFFPKWWSQFDSINK